MLANKRAVQLTTSLARSYATRYPRPRPGTSERPPLKHRDPLTQSRNATVVELEEEGVTFIHRPPPSAASPASLTTAPSSPLLRKDAAGSSKAVPLPPVIGKKQPTPEYTPLSEKDIAKMQELRVSDPLKYSTKKLSEMFGCSRYFVTLATRLKQTQITQMRRQQEAEHAKNRERWSDRHKLVKAVRQRRKLLW